MMGGLFGTADSLEKVPAAMRVQGLCTYSGSDSLS